MNVLIACEFSGAVRDEFIRQGINAVSCDLLPSDSDFGPHLQGDVLRILDYKWTAMIAFPPCTYLCNSGVRWLYKDGRKENGKDSERWREMNPSHGFFSTVTIYAEY